VDTRRRPGQQRHEAGAAPASPRASLPTSTACAPTANRPCPIPPSASGADTSVCTSPPLRAPYSNRTLGSSQRRPMHVSTCWRRWAAPLEGARSPLPSQADRSEPSRSRRAVSSSPMSLARRTMRAGARRRRTVCTPKRQFGHRRTENEANGHRRTENEARHHPSPDRNATTISTNHPDQPARPTPTGRTTRPRLAAAALALPFGEHFAAVTGLGGQL
jgi:hypothetical protein